MTKASQIIRKKQESRALYTQSLEQNISQLREKVNQQKPRDGKEPKLIIKLRKVNTLKMRLINELRQMIFNKKTRRIFSTLMTL